MFSLSLEISIVSTCISQESQATVSYGIRNLVQELELPQCGGRHRSRRSSWRDGELCFHVTAISMGLLLYI